MAARAPDGWNTLTPRIFTNDAAGLVGFLRQVFGATGQLQSDRPSELRIGDSTLMVSGTEFREPMGAFLYVYVDEVDATHGRAVDVGAVSLEAPTDQPYGDRRAMVSDSWGNVWQIASRG